MTLGGIGAFLLLLLAVFVIGNLWFHFVEGVLERIKTRFGRHKQPPAWHLLPPEEDRRDG